MLETIDPLSAHKKMISKCCRRNEENGKNCDFFFKWVMKTNSKKFISIDKRKQIRTKAKYEGQIGMEK